MPLPKDINEYLRAWAPELGERILQTYPPLQRFDDVASPLTDNSSKAVSCPDARDDGRGKALD